jgi:hypothetical protein
MNYKLTLQKKCTFGPEYIKFYIIIIMSHIIEDVCWYLKLKILISYQTLLKLHRIYLACYLVD